MKSLAFALHVAPVTCSQICTCFAIVHYSLRGGVVYQQQSQGKVGFGVLFYGETVFVVVL